MAKPVNKKWTHEEVCRLIQTYESNPILWDIQHRKSKDRTKKNVVMEKIATDFDCPVSEISRKLHNLRNQVSQELKKMKNRKTEDTTSWPYFSALSFIVPTLQAADKRSALMPTSSKSRKENVGRALPNTVEGDDTTQDDETHVNFLPNKKMKTRQVEVEDNDSTIKAALRVLSKTPDEHDKFGEYVATELRSIKFEYVRRRLKTDIRKAILTAAEEEDAYFMPNSSGCSSSDPTPTQMSPYPLLETQNPEECPTTSA